MRHCLVHVDNHSYGATEQDDLAEDKGPSQRRRSVVPPATPWAEDLLIPVEAVAKLLVVLGRLDVVLVCGEFRLLSRLEHLLLPGRRENLSVVPIGEAGVKGVSRHYYCCLDLSALGVMEGFFEAIDTNNRRKDARQVK
jgi:hypothetical protein